MSIVESPVLVEQVPAWDHSATLVVIGLGVAGACAGLEAHRGGTDVLVLERASGGGGASALSQGIFYFGGGTDVQAACGYHDSVENMYDFLRAVTSTEDEQSLRVFCEQSVEQFDWLEAQGVPFKREAFKGKAVYIRTGEGLLITGNEKVWPFRDTAAPVSRGHQVSGSGEISGGSVAMQALLSTVGAEQVPVMYDTAVTALVVDGKRVVGVKARKQGKDLYVRATGGVLIAAGSFNLNEEIIHANMPIYAQYGKPLGTPQNDGAGLLLGQSVGGATQGMHGVCATASIYPPADLIKGIIVNANGERFVPEDAYHARTAHYINLQPGARAYLILDEEIFDYPKHGSHVFMDAYETVNEMAQALGVPADTLQATLDEYNHDAHAGVDARFHKHADWLKPLHAPYAVFNISITSSDYHWMSLGGLWTNADAQVLDQAGTPIAGLYAAGASASHLAQDGDEYASGMSLAAGSLFGRRAAQPVGSNR